MKKLVMVIMFCTVLGFAQTPPKAATVSTDSVSHIFTTTALLHGTIDANNTDVYGVFFEYGETGSFISNITELTANTTYYVRAYAINSTGTSYGSELNFTTLQAS